MWPVLSKFWVLMKSPLFESDSHCLASEEDFWPTKLCLSGLVRVFCQDPTLCHPLRESDHHNQRSHGWEWPSGMWRLTESRVGPRIKGLWRVKRLVWGKKIKTRYKVHPQHQHALCYDMGTPPPLTMPAVIPPWTARAGHTWGPVHSWVYSLLPHARPKYAGNHLS